MAVLLGACVAALAHAMPGGEASAKEPTAQSQRAEPLSCLVLDEQTPARLKLTADQSVEWQRLQQEHALLFGDRCHAGGSSQGSTAAATSAPSTLPTKQSASSARAMQVYRKDFIDFLGGLSAEQRRLLEEAARIRQNRRAELEQKAILHRLML